MPKLKPTDICPTPEEEAAILAGIAEDPDDFESTPELWKYSHPGTEVMPNFIKRWKRNGGVKNKRPLKRVKKSHMSRCGWTRTSWRTTAQAAWTPGGSASTKSCAKRCAPNGRTASGPSSTQRLRSLSARWASPIRAAQVRRSRRRRRLRFSARRS